MTKVDIGLILHQIKGRKMTREGVCCPSLPVTVPVERGHLWAHPPFIRSNLSISVNVVSRQTKSICLAWMEYTSASNRMCHTQTWEWSKLGKEDTEERAI